MSSITSEVESYNTDDDLSTTELIVKYQRDFTTYFGPKYAYGVISVDYNGGYDEMKAKARVRPAYKSTKGKTATFGVSKEKFNVWRKNVKLYKFIT